METHDIAIIGGGIVGLASARALIRRFPGRSIVVLEKEPRVGTHQTGRNSGVIHSGLYYRPGTLRARLAVDGARAMVDFCRREGLPLRECGKTVVAVREREVSFLENLRERGVQNGIPGLERIGPDRLKQLEPHAAGVAALWVPTTAATDYSAVACRYAETFTGSGGRVITDCRLLGAAREGGIWRIATTQGEQQARFIVTCAGLHADRVSAACGHRPGVRIVPFRGEYYKLRPDGAALVNALIYPVPDPDLPFLGVHLTRGVDGTVEAGPNAVLAFAREGYCRTAVSVRDTASFLSYPGFWRFGIRFFRVGLAEQYRSIFRGVFLRSVQALLPELKADHLGEWASGIRAQAMRPDGRLEDDFRIERSEGAVHVLNAPSPAATASLLIGEKVADYVADTK